ncbi:Crp/Fnr family transcriptional regulator [Putridiphycobacter roseus]|uniref:Crp/Fnr family transcriptional regulator n=1 Tax=Putridiphycobacter roseus TaxID=2219161 RepID=A0A2W1NNL1_9FLAO|nr:Crp/Fnr family transcriptional regulator [Putridiphycobacter roseus]PZE16188.1 Crp/Fnr family transcriptional regulator [Putridiphycobacter roseus]
MAITENDFLAVYPQLNDLALVKDIINNSKIISLKEGEILIDLDENMESFPLILSGSLKILREDEEGNEVFLYYVNSGNTCATTVSCCLNKTRSNIRAIIEEDAVFLSIPNQFMDHWIKDYEVWRNYIFQSMTQRFNDMLYAVDQLAFKKMDERILHYIQETARTTKNNILHISHQEIAVDMNTSREVVSRLLKQLENEGIVKLGRGKITLL